MPLNFAIKRNQRMHKMCGSSQCQMSLILSIYCTMQKFPRGGFIFSIFHRYIHFLWTSWGHEGWPQKREHGSSDVDSHTNKLANHSRDPSFVHIYALLADAMREQWKCGKYLSHFCRIGQLCPWNITLHRVMVLRREYSLIFLFCPSSLNGCHLIRTRDFSIPSHLRLALDLSLKQSR